jgi:hypothetical protein
VARPAGLEPATPGLEGCGYEAAGGSAAPLPPFLLGFSHTRDDPRRPQPITDCHLFVTRLAARVLGVRTDEHDLFVSEGVRRVTERRANVLMVAPLGN